MASPTSAASSSASTVLTTPMQDLSIALESGSSSSESSESDYDAHPTSTDSFDLDAKPPLITANSAPPVLQNDYEAIKEGFSFGTCPSMPDFVGTPVAEMGQFEYPDIYQAAGSSRRSSLMHPSLRRGSSTSSTMSTITALSSTTTRRPSLAPSGIYSPGPSSQENLGRRRGSMFHFQTKPVSGPIPPSLLARRGSLPGAEAIFGLPSTERKPFNRLSLSAAPPAPQSPSTSPTDTTDPPRSPSNRRPSFKLRLSPKVGARRGSIPANSPTLPPTAEIEPPTQPSQPYNRQSTSSNSSRGSLLSHSSLMSEEAIRDDGDSTDQDTGVEVDTPGSSSETEAMGLFSDPWKSTTPQMKPKEEGNGGVSQRSVTVL